MSLIGAGAAVVGLTYWQRRQPVQARGRSNLKDQVKPAPIRCRDGTVVIPYLAPSRDQQLQRLRTEEFDVLVIGGGCVGSGVALDAAMRGMKTAMVEADDFAAGTSGRSTKLIHGGIRYLETAFKKLDYGSYELVKEALEERAYMLRAAPYMNKPLPIMIPIYTWWELPYMWAGAKMYDLIAGGQRAVPPSHFMSGAEALYNFPMLNAAGLKGAIIYYDGQMNDTRMSLTVALTATQEGAAVANRVKVVRLLKDARTGRVCGARLRDELPPNSSSSSSSSSSAQEWNVYAKAVVNATGCFADSIRHLDDPAAQPLITPAAGVHVMLPDHFSPSKMGLIVPKTTDGRVLFFLPWEGATIAGTTDSESELTMAPRPTQQEIDFIIQESNRFLSCSVKRSDAIAAWSGIRPLVRDPAKLGEGGTKSLSRSHVVEVSPSGLITITGGKWTTFRRMAQDTVDRLLKELPAVNAQGSVRSQCTTASASLLGADRAGIVCAQKFDTINVTLRGEYGLSSDVAKHLVANYGTRALQIAEIAAHRAHFLDRAGHPLRLSPRYPFLEAEVAFAVEQEYAVKAVDVLARRTRLAFIDAKAARTAAPRVTDIMADLLGWGRSRKAAELQECLAFIDTMSPSSSSNNSSSRHQEAGATPLPVPPHKQTAPADATAATGQPAASA